MTARAMPSPAEVVLPGGDPSRRERGPSSWPVGPGVALAYLVMALIVMTALWPELFATHAPDAVNPIEALAGPGAHHWFGTDQLGRDVYSRIVYGARPSLTVGVGATLIALATGTVLAAVAVTGGRVADEIVMRFTDVFLAMPGVLLALLVVAVLGPGTTHATLALGCAFAPGFTRLVRGQALVVRDSDYVRAAVVLGYRRTTILVRHVLPNALSPLLVLATVNIGAAILAGSSLSFLGLGPQPPAPEWGGMLAGGRDFLGAAWAMAVFPGLALTATVIAVNVLGRDLRLRFEGRYAGGHH
jgi:peptide/nickel transport system permease protein